VEVIREDLSLLEKKQKNGWERRSTGEKGWRRGIRAGKRGVAKRVALRGTDYLFI